MADNIAITAGTGTTVATDDIGGVHYQRVKPTLGADGTAVDVSAGAGAVGTGVQRVTLASDDPAVTGVGAPADAAWTTGNGSMIALLKAMAGALLSLDDAFEYETVAASQTDQVLGATGEAGDYIDGIYIQPTSTTCGVVTVKDGATTVFSYPGGTVDASLRGWFVPLGFSAATEWTVTTGAGVTAVPSGNFT